MIAQNLWDFFPPEMIQFTNSDLAKDQSKTQNCSGIFFQNTREADQLMMVSC